VIQATAKVSLIGKSDVFDDYEIGFIQTILDDLMIAQYVSGSMVAERLPVPIRAAGLRGVAVPVPWMAKSAVQRPNTNGEVSISAGWTLETDFALHLGLLEPAQSGDFLDTWQRRTNVAIWLVARRLDAPLDRFSVVPIDGRTYDLRQNLDLDFRRVRGDMLKPGTPQLDKPLPSGEREDVRLVGAFQAFETSSQPADVRLAQLAGPSGAEVDLRRQIMQILGAPPATESGLTRGEYIEVVRRILDTPEILDPNGQRAARRLGFVFDPLTFSLRFDTSSGRLIPVRDLLNPKTGAVITERKDFSVIVDSPGVGRVALNHLAMALGLRLQKFDFLGEGHAIILRRSEIPQNGQLVFSFPALQTEPQLLADSKVKEEMAEMWACSEITLQSERFIIGKEFAKTYWLDRSGSIQRNPTDGFFTSRSTGEEITTNVECGNLAGAALGMAHSHPEASGDGPNPSEKDLAVAAKRTCGRQYFIISNDLVVIYFPNGAKRSIGSRESVLPRGVPCRQNIPEDQEVL
jgi:hypothetical protein